MANRRSFRCIEVLFLTTVVLVYGMTPVGAQDSALKPVITVLPFQNSTDSSSLSTVASTVSNTMELTLRLLGDYRVSDIPEGRIPTEVSSGDRDSIDDFSERESIDYVVFGEIQETNGQILVRASVYSRGEGRVTVSQRVTSDSVLEVFEATDKIAIGLLSEFSGQRIAFGELRLVREGWPSGEYVVYIDGSEAGRSVTSVERVLIGPRFVEVRAENGPAVGDTIFSAPVYMEEGVTVTVRFSMVAPADSQTATGPRFEVERMVGSIRVTVETGGVVYLDGERIGELEAGQSATIRDVDTGRRRVEIRYADGERENSRVTVRSGTAATARFSYVERVEPEAPEYSIGDRGPAGGIVFYDKGQETDGWRFLEAAPEDLFIMRSRLLRSDTRVEEFSWDDAMNIARDFRFGGYEDWRLPTKEELEEMRKNREFIGNFGSTAYWSSSEGSSSSAWYQYFSSGDHQYRYNAKSDLGRVRAIRAF